mgnify:CR=1 FL=1
MLRLKATQMVQRGMERSGIKSGLTRSHTLVLVAQRMAVAVIGGLITSTFLSLLVIPVVFTYVDDLMARFRSPA